MDPQSKKQFLGILIRSTLTDTGMLPRTGDVSNSPDVIPYGIQQAANPESLFVKNFNKDLGVDLQASQTNYIYLRGINTDTSFEQGDLYLYFSLDSDLNDPTIWSKNQLNTSKGQPCFSVTAQQKGNIVVTTDPFTWVPPADGQSYSLIAILVGHGENPDFSGVTDFESYVDKNGNVGWNKVTIKQPAPPPKPPLLWSTTFNYVQGDTEREMHFTLNCTNIPVNSLVSFDTVPSAENPANPDPPILLNQTKVTSSPNFTAGIISTVPAGYKGQIRFSLYAIAPPSGSSVSFIASYNPPSSGGPVRPVLVEQVTTTN